MNPFIEMTQKIQSSSNYDDIQRFVRPLYDNFGINHIWCYQITYSGNYLFLGTHSEWTEYCFEHYSLLNNFPCLRHPKVLNKGLSLMKNYEDENFNKAQEIAWKKFNINFNLNFIECMPYGIRAFGFGSRFNDSKSDERLLNELPVLQCFANLFIEKCERTFHLNDSATINLSSYIGSSFHEKSKEINFPLNRETLLRALGYESVLSLTLKEKEILKYLANGYPASYIKNKVKLGLRTVENYIVTIKEKLYCHSKVELIHKAKEIVLTGFLDS